MTQLIQSSFTYKLLEWLIEPVWNDTLGRTFLLTVLFYLIGYSIYGGYLSRFTGGFGGLTFGRLGIELLDFITLFPTAIATMVRVFQEGIKVLWPLMIYGVLYVLSSHIVAIFAIIGIRPLLISIPSSQPELVIQLGMILYICGLFLPLTFVSFNYRWYRKKFWLIYIWLLQAIGLILLSVVRPAEFASGEQANVIPPFLIVIVNVLTPIAWELSLILLLVSLIILLPIVLGAKMAEVAVEEGILSRVLSLVVNQPLQNLNSFVYNLPPDQTKVVANWKQLWFTKPSFNVKVEPDIYIYTATKEHPIYLLASFQSYLALYIPQDDNSNDTNGKLVIVANNLIHSLELQSFKLQKQKAI